MASFRHGDQTLTDLPDNLKAGIRAWLTERREQYLAEQRAEAEARMRSYLPQIGLDGNGDEPQPP